MGGKVETWLESISERRSKIQRRVVAKADSDDADTQSVCSVWPVLEEQQKDLHLDSMKILAQFRHLENTFPEALETAGVDADRANTIQSFAAEWVHAVASLFLEHSLRCYRYMYLE